MSRIYIKKKELQQKVILENKKKLMTIKAINEKLRGK